MGGISTQSMDLDEFLLGPLHSSVAPILLLSLTIWATRVVLNRWNRGRRRHPIRGTVFHSVINFRRIYHYLTDIASETTTFRILNLFRSAVMTTDPANIEHFLKTNFANYTKGSYQQEILTDLLGEGIFTVDGERWQHQRKVSSYEFSTRKLRDFSSQVFRKNASKLARLLSQATDSGRSVEIYDLFMKFGMDTTFNVLLGVELDNLCGTNEEGAEFSEAFNAANCLLSRRYIDVSWKIKRLLNIGTEAMLNDKLKVVDDFVYKIIERKIVEEHHPQDPSSVKREDIVSRFLASNERDPKLLRDIALSFIFAGKDTSVITLCWFIYMVCKQPEIQEKIATEVREATGISDSVSFDDAASTLTDDALNKMHYLHATLAETLRLYPPLPVDGKTCVSDDIWPDGFTVSGGDFVVYNAYGMGRMASLWGEDAEVFRPERWVDENGVFQQPSSFKFISFHAGPRICLGKEFAYRQMKIVSALLVSEFAFRLSDEMREINYKAGLTLHIDGDLLVRASPRKMTRVDKYVK